MHDDIELVVDVVTSCQSFSRYLMVRCLLLEANRLR